MTDQDLLGDPFRVIGHLGSGGYGAVYAAERTATGEKVAVKVFESDLVQSQDEHARLLREVNNARQLNHPNVVQVFEYGVLPNGRPYYAMELCRGYSIAHLLAEVEPPDVARVVHLMLEVLDGLGAAHDLGIMHRDMKLVNVQVVEAPGSVEQAKILDFGLAKRPGGGQSQELTKDGQVFGTAAYIAPEALMGDPIDGRADLYACGIMLFELIARRRPYPGDTPQAIVEGHIRSPVPSLRKTAGRRRVNKKLDAVVAKALAKRPDDRFASAAALSQALLVAAPRARETTFPFVAEHLSRSPESLRIITTHTLDVLKDSSSGISGLAVPAVYSDTSVVGNRLSASEFDPTTGSLRVAVERDDAGSEAGSPLPPPGKTPGVPESSGELRVPRAMRSTLPPPRAGALPASERPSDGLRPLAGTSRFEAFEVLADAPAWRLTRGLDRDHSRPVLIRTIKKEALTPEELARTLRGCASQAQVLHDHVLRIFGRGRVSEGSPIVIYEWMPGNTLRKRLENLGAVTPERAAGIACQILEGLEAVHLAGVLHRAVDSRHVRLFEGEDGPVAKLSVFDWSTRMDGHASTAWPVGEQVLTSMAPEQILGEELDERVDVYGTGAVLFELLTAQRFEPSVYDAAKANGEWSHLAPLLERAVTRHREERYADARSFRRDLYQHAGPFAVANLRQLGG